MSVAVATADSTTTVDRMPVVVVPAVVTPVSIAVAPCLALLPEVVVVVAHVTRLPEVQPVPEVARMA